MKENEEPKEAKETVEDIVAEFREMVHKSVDGIIAVKADVIADRIEAAWKRDEKHAVEHATQHAEAVARGNCRDCIYNPQSENYEVGNAAAMREALIAVSKAFDDSLICTDSQMSMGECDRLDDVYHKVKAALSAPPRNCDVMDWRTAWAKWRTENHPQKPVGYSECYESTTMFMDWYTGTDERKGESDGR